MPFSFVPQLQVAQEGIHVRGPEIDVTKRLLHRMPLPCFKCLSDLILGHVCEQLR